MSGEVGGWREAVGKGEGRAPVSSSSVEKAALMDPYHYICRASGKGVRPKLVAAFNLWLQIPEEKIVHISDIVQMLHNASLMIDDIEDGSILRRGRPVTHKVYGNPLTINSANYVYFLALQRTIALQHPEATHVFTEQMLDLHRGQGMEIYWRDTVTPPTEDQYQGMVIQKTGGLFKLATRLMALFSETAVSTEALVETLGLFFQIRDDYVNLTSEDYSREKSFAEDLTEGKFSYPVIHALSTAGPEERAELLHIIRQRPREVELKKHAVSLLQSLGSFTYTKTRSHFCSTFQQDLLRTRGITNNFFCKVY